MTSISWETLKKNCVHEMMSKLRYTFDETYSELCTIRVGMYQQQEETKLLGDTHKFIEELIKRFTADINDCDIRNYWNLMKVLPKAFPAWIICGNCEIEYCDSGWFFVRKY